MVIISIVLSAVGIVISFAAGNLAGPPIGLIFGIVGLVLATKARSGGQGGSTVALAISIIAIVLCIIRIIFVLACVGVVADMVT